MKFSGFSLAILAHAAVLSRVWDSLYFNDTLRSVYAIILYLVCIDGLFRNLRHVGECTQRLIHSGLEP